jgi:hypothetical protein
VWVLDVDPNVPPASMKEMTKGRLRTTGHSGIIYDTFNGARQGEYE